MNVTNSNTGSPDPVSPPIGRLIVRIMQARNLAVQSHNSVPYVVCRFESNESITRGPTLSNENMTSNNMTGTYSRGFSGKASDSRANTIVAGNHSDLNAGYKGPGVYADTTNGINSIAIPSKSRQGSTTNLQDLTSRVSAANSGANPYWKHEAVYDVLGDHSEIELSIYDEGNNDAFLGFVRFTPKLKPDAVEDQWYPLSHRVEGEVVSGLIRLQTLYEPISKRHYGPDDFEILRLVGKGTFGQVYQVRKKDTNRIYAMKVLSKKVIVQKKEVAHTIGERNILVRTATTESPFIVGLKFSFQTPTDLYLVTDYMSGGELFWHLQKEGRFSEARAKFYIAELILALEHLHIHDIVYRDLKPENILLDANGHIALCDFGLSKANLSSNATTNTFCGTTEYLAPEVLLDDQGYTKMVDFWSLGVLIFEMCCGWSPFYADDTQQMYKNIAYGKVRFPKDALSSEGRNFVKGLLNRNPKHRLGAMDDARELKAHPFFADVDWSQLLQKKVPPPFKPHLKSETDTSNFDPEFTNASTSVFQNGRYMIASTPLSPTMQANFQGFTFVDESSIDDHFRDRRLPPIQDSDNSSCLAGKPGRLVRQDTSATITPSKVGSVNDMDMEMDMSVTYDMDYSDHEAGHSEEDEDSDSNSRKMSGIEDARGRQPGNRYYEDDLFDNGQPIDI
ncbi:kinase-like domain-containing protein [Dipodascopsis tothii]|uniref:kinase-like domain-containing protein n=1 Tax=Dipodascopsis tothii TaxID=44089 RepID=UPI0034CFA186